MARRSWGVCVDDGWFKQPGLAWDRLIRLWRWGRQHTCCALSNLCSQVKPAINTHTHTRDRSNMVALITCFIYNCDLNSAKNCFSTTPPSSLILEKPPRRCVALNYIKCIIIFTHFHEKVWVGCMIIQNKCYNYLNQNVSHTKIVHVLSLFGKEYKYIQMCFVFIIWMVTDDESL